MSIVVEESRISIAKRLFMTATPRILRRRARTGAGASTGEEVFSMDDPRFYGRCGRSAHNTAKLSL